MRLAYGAVQRKGTLDHLIEQLAERPAGGSIRRCWPRCGWGCYELLYLRGSPDYAVVADAVELAKANGARRPWPRQRGAAPRRARRTRRAAGALTDDTPQQAADQALPSEWIARLWWDALGAEQARALMACDNEPGEVALRANTLVTDAPTLAEQLPVRDPPRSGDPRGAGAG